MSGNAVFESTVDPANWAGATTSIVACGDGDQLSIWFDGTYVHYVRYYSFDLFYRRGEPQAGGTITWSAVEQVLYNGNGTDYYAQPCIAVDSDGYAWIGANYYDGSDYTPYAIKNANNNGTWALDFATELDATSNISWRVAPIPLTSAKVYLIYCTPSNPPLGKLYNAGWGGEESDLADFIIANAYAFCAVANGDNVHFVYIRHVGDRSIRHNERVWGVGWNENDVLVQSSVANGTGPTLSIDTATGRLYCFWTATSTDHVYYKRYTGVWGSLVDWIDESTDEIVFAAQINSFYTDYGGYIGVLYTTKLASPYNVRFDYLTMAGTWEGKISGVTDPAEIAGVPVATIANVKGVV